MRGSKLARPFADGQYYLREQDHEVLAPLVLNWLIASLRDIERNGGCTDVTTLVLATAEQFYICGRDGKTIPGDVKMWVCRARDYVVTENKPKRGEGDGS